MKNDLALLANYKPHLLTETPLTAAVMVLIVESEKEPAEIIITKRALTLPLYAGHYSLPGGMHDATDHTLFATAEREIHEELSVPPTAYQYVGQLDDFHDRYNNLVRPFITIMKKNDFVKLCQPSPHEISEIYFFSFAKRNQIKDDPIFHTITSRRPSYTFSEGHVFIWGLTAAILAHFFAVLEPL